MSAIVPTRLRVEHRMNPRGIEARRPRLSWMLDTSERGQRQTAYQVLVASSHGSLDKDTGDLWDSGKVESGDAILVPYAGRELLSGGECFWKVRVWNAEGEEGPYSEPSIWAMGLLNEKSDWKADWIGFDEPLEHDLRGLEPVSLTGSTWYYAEDTLAPEDEDVLVGYRRGLELPEGRPLKRVRVAFGTAGDSVLYVNGVAVGKGYDRYFSWIHPSQADATPHLKDSGNVLAMGVETTYRTAAALMGSIILEYADGACETLDLGDGMRAMVKPQSGWEKPDFDDGLWQEVVAVGKDGDAPWGTTGTAPLYIPPASYLRKSFSIQKPVKRATAYASALGVYELHLNGQAVSDEVLAPGWTDYFKRVPYRAYDVTAQLNEGENAIGALLGAGWYAGYFAFQTHIQGNWGSKPRFRAQLTIEYQDGTEETIMTDGTWQAAHSPIVSADLYDGERYDARMEIDGWDTPGVPAGDWRPVLADAPEKVGPMASHKTEPVRRMLELKPVSANEVAQGVHVFDLGQNFVGWVQLRVSGPEGTVLTLRHGEMLNPDGTLYVRNLRGAAAIDQYILRGDEEEIWEPTFTFHGFRFVEVSGLPGSLSADAVTGVVVYSELEPTGEFACSHEGINHLQSNILWGQRGNFLEVPTDCPQRDERLGWMGDAQIFAPTAHFNMDTAAFFTKWMDDVVDAQSEEGAYPDTAPRLGIIGKSCPAWADAGIIVPWTHYWAYGDKGILETHYDSMRRYVDYLEAGNPDYLWLNNRGPDHGDWLDVNAPTSKDVLATAFYAWSSDLLSRIADVLGRGSDAARYGDLSEKVKKAFCEAYVDKEGRIESDTQTAYVLAIRFGLTPDAMRPVLAQHLVDRVRDRDWHLSTGFVASAHLLFALSETGHLDVAYRLLEQESYPSWLYPIAHGATTMWERWNGWTHEGGFGDVAMNSFNHYAFGAVGQWMYEVMAGIQAATPGYREILIAPRPGGSFTRTRAALRCPHGRIESAWSIDGEKLVLRATIPANTSAVIRVPGGGAATESQGVTQAEAGAGVTVFRAEPGSYEFTADWAVGK